MTYDSPASGKVSMISLTLFKRSSSLVSLYVFLGPIGLDTGIWNSVLLRLKVLTYVFQTTFQLLLLIPQLWSSIVPCCL